MGAHLTTTFCSGRVTTSPSKVTRPWRMKDLASERLHTPCLRGGVGTGVSGGGGSFEFLVGVAPGKDLVDAFGHPAVARGFLFLSGTTIHPRSTLLLLLEAHDDPLVVLLPLLLLRQRHDHLARR